MDLVMLRRVVYTRLLSNQRYPTFTAVSCRVPSVSQQVVKWAEEYAFLEEEMSMLVRRTINTVF